MEPRIKCKRLRGLQTQLEWFSTERDLVAAGGDSWRCPGTLVVVTAGGGWGPGVEWAEVKHPSIRPAAPRTAPYPGTARPQTPAALRPRNPTPWTGCPPPSPTVSDAALLPPAKPISSVPSWFQQASSKLTHPTAFLLILASDWSATRDIYMVGPPWCLTVKNLPATQETQVRSLVRKSPGEGNGNPLQYPCLGNPMDGGAWRATVHGVAKSQTQLSDCVMWISA